MKKEKLRLKCWWLLRWPFYSTSPISLFKVDHCEKTAAAARGTPPQRFLFSSITVDISHLHKSRGVCIELLILCVWGYICWFFFTRKSMREKVTLCGPFCRQLSSCQHIYTRGEGRSRRDQHRRYSNNVQQEPIISSTEKRSPRAMNNKLSNCWQASDGKKTNSRKARGREWVVWCCSFIFAHRPSFFEIFFFFLLFKQWRRVFPVVVEANRAFDPHFLILSVCIWCCLVLT